MAFILTLGLVFLSTASAADPCARIKFVEDPFTHARVSEAHGGAGIGPGGWFLRWDASYAASGTSLTLNMIVSGARKEALPPGFTVQFLTEDSSIVALTTVTETPPVVSAEQAGVYTTWASVLPLDAAALTALAAQPTVQIRAPIPGGDITWSHKKSGFQKPFACNASLQP